MAIAATVASIGAVTFSGHEGPAHGPALPRDPVAAALFIQARDDWAERSATSLGRSIEEFDRVTRREPSFAPAFADLADAYLLGGEAGSLAAQIAYDRAQRAAQHALQLDPHLPAAHRALGFIGYWWNNDRIAARRFFRQALALDPGDAQTHFWYANVLADNGEEAAAAREFDRARLIDPGSVPIATDHAWALWQAGRTDEAAARLQRLLADHPDDAEAHDCLGMIAFASGDMAGYARELRSLARLRKEPGLANYSRQVERALARGGLSGVRAAALAHALEAQAVAPFPNRAIAAFFASEAGDEAALRRILVAAERDHEQWGSAGFIRRIAGRWKANRAVMTLLARRRPPRMETADPG